MALFVYALCVLTYTSFTAFGSAENLSVSGLKRERRGANVQSIAMAGPAIQLIQSDLRPSFEMKAAISSEDHQAPNNDGEDDEEEGHAGRGGAMWGLARLMLWLFLGMLAGALAVSFATQLGALCRGCKQLCCFCVRREQGQGAAKPRVTIRATDRQKGNRSTDVRQKKRSGNCRGKSRRK